MIPYTSDSYLDFQLKNITAENLNALQPPPPSLLPPFEARNKPPPNAR